MTESYNIADLPIIGKDQDVKFADLNLGEKHIIGVYFSAHWCPPCRTFTPMLKKIYEECNSGTRKFEVIFVSLDRDKSQFEEYYKEMPWYAVDYEKKEERENFAEKCGVAGIPMLILFNSKGQLLTKEGRSKVQGGEFPWGLQSD